MSKIWQPICPYFSSVLIQWKCKINHIYSINQTPPYISSIAKVFSLGGKRALTHSDPTGHLQENKRNLWEIRKGCVDKVTDRNVGGGAAVSFLTWNKKKIFTGSDYISKNTLTSTWLTNDRWGFLSSPSKLHLCKLENSFLLLFCKSTFLAKWSPSKLIFL